MLRSLIDMINMLRILANEKEDADDGEWIPELHKV